MTGGVTDGLGNPISGDLNVFRLDTTTGVYEEYFDFDVYANGYIDGSLSDGTYKFSFDTGYITEYYKDKADPATSDAIVVSGGAPVQLGGWTIDQPYILGKITNAAGKPPGGAAVDVFNAADGDYLGGIHADDKGAFKIPTQAAPVKVAFSANDYALEFYSDAADLASAYPITALASGTDVGNVVLAPRWQRQRPGDQ
ncbi:hypothetical protein [Nocardioides sp. B-3]|uniref:hypothetical protein n=1 Tax=Nocardioides sp. B-3 TaxID=2895565 RepID=UPI002152AF32|nr:hypothetical protein [Nocardioides sp. B-3]UUZ57624.1 hypothetical protein LP418_14270 [Nocardioides sp. B-3]